MLQENTMGSRVPLQIKKKILQEWLQGISRDSIAKSNNIGTGTVTNIIKQSKVSVPDIDLLREVAQILRKENLGIGHFASSIRLKRVLNKFGLSEGMVESMLKEIDLHCFKNGTTAKEFVSEIDRVSKLVESLGVSLEEMPSLMSQRVGELESLDVEISDRRRRILNLIAEYQTTREDLDEFRANRPLLDKIRKLEAEGKAKDEEIASQRKMILGIQLDLYMEACSRSTSEVELDKANRLLSEEGEPIDFGEWTSGNEPIDVKELYALSDELCQHPSHNIDIIKLLRHRVQLRKETNLT